MNRLNRFSDCIAKFCKETGKPGPCADPNSKRQQRLKGLAAKAKPAPAQSRVQQEKAKHSNDALDALLDNDMPAYNKAAGRRSRLDGLAKTGKRPGGKIEDVTSKDLVKPDAVSEASKQIRATYENFRNVDYPEINRQISDLGRSLSVEQARQVATDLGIHTAKNRSKKYALQKIKDRIADRKGSYERGLAIAKAAGQ